MKIFKYLIFLFIFASTFTHSALFYKIKEYGGLVGTSSQEVCNMFLEKRRPSLILGPSETVKALVNAEQTVCTIQKYPINVSYGWTYIESVNAKCPEKGTPQPVQVNYGDKIPTRICAGQNGLYCSFSNPNPDVYNYPSSQITILRSDSDIPFTQCTPTFKNTSCDTKDPYGGCYTPPNDGCTRGSNGSIYCPPDTPPPEIEKGCKGASYCDRPPQGCGSDYVSGSFNGKAVCVKKGGDASGGASGGSGDGDGNGSNSGSGSGGGDTTTTTSNSDGSKTTVSKDSNGNTTSTTVTNADGSKTTTNVNSNGSSTTTTTNSNGQTTVSNGQTTTTKNSDGSTTITTINNNNTTVINVSSDGKTTTTTTNKGSPDEKTTSGDTKNDFDLSGVISAINRVVDKLSWLKNELNTSISEVSNRIDITNKNLDDLKNKADQTNEKIDQTNKNLTDIKDALANLKNGNPDQPSSASQALDLSETNKKLDSIDKNGKDLNQFMKEDLKPSGSSEDGKVDIIENEIDNKFDGSILKATGTCPPPLEININLISQYTLRFEYTTFCNIASFIRPIVIFCGMFIAFMIVTGHRSTTDA